MRVLINNDYKFILTNKKKRMVWNNGKRILRIYIKEEQAMYLIKTIILVQRPINILKKVTWKKDVIISVMKKQIIKHYFSCAQHFNLHCIF